MVLSREQIGSELQYSDIHLAEDGIYLMSGDPSSAFAYLQFFSFESKELSRLRKVERGNAHGLSVSPDGRYIIFARQTMPDNRDLRLVENFWLE